VVADIVNVVDAQDPSILYFTPNDRDKHPTWTLVKPSKNSCDTPQMLTTRLQDWMSFTFIGTGVAVVGTVGVRQGIINIEIDGKSVATVDRGRKKLECDYVLFEVENLTYDVHTVIATLVGRKKNPNTGKQDGLLSIQELRYTVPDGN
ncbi:hypothetical protein FRB90_004422, partial [Tulasnella sp. 427]